MIDAIPVGWKISAGRLGISVAVYRAHLEQGELWCTGHKRWEPADQFNYSRRHREHRKPSCRAWERAQQYQRYGARRVSEGQPYQPRQATAQCPTCHGKGRIPVMESA